jgi:bacterioferritin B
MISERLAGMLTAQIASELTAHQNYMGICLYFKRRSLDGWAELFLEQSKEEAGHAYKIMNFLTDCEVEFDLPALPLASTKFGSALDAVKSAKASEAKVSAEFRAMAKAAMEEADTTAFQFLQWFIEEQVEEESKMNKLIDLIESGINLFQAEPLLAQFEEE